MGVRDLPTGMNSSDVAKRWLEYLRLKSLSNEDIAWAVNHGAKKPNDKRAKALSSFYFGATKIMPYDGDWYSSEWMIAALDELGELVRV